MRSLLVLAALAVICFGEERSLPPYWNVPSEEIDSSEYGGVAGPKATTCPCGWTNKEAARIIGGVEAGVNEYPFTVFLYVPERLVVFCGGTIITRRHVLTAAHCAEEFPDERMTVVAGDHNYNSRWDTQSTTLINVERRIIHENYPSLVYDIAVLVLESEMDFSQNIGPVCLPTGKLNLLGEYVKTMGWGKMSRDPKVKDYSPVLRKVNQRVVQLEYCTAFSGRYQVDLVNRHQLCLFAKNKGFAPSDSGGTIVWLDPETNRYTLVGLPSFYNTLGETNLVPDVAIDVTTFLPWINDKIQATAETCTAAN